MLKPVQVLKLNRNVNQYSPVFPDYGFKIEYDEEGREISTFPKIDFKAIIDANGTVDDWKLDNLLKAGIDPNKMNVHTTFPSRIDGAPVVGEFISVLDSVAVPNNDSSNDKNE